MKKNETIKIALYGIGGVYNYGCEAIVRGTEKILHSRFPNASIDYISKRPKDDKKRLHDCNVQIVPAYKTGLFSFRCVNKLEKIIRRFNNNFEFKLVKPFYRWVKNYDFIFSIGGDLYTLPPNPEKAEKDGFSSAILNVGRYAKTLGTKMIVWGASIGPFEPYSSIKELYFSHFKECISYITPREQLTADYLKNNGFFDFKMYADPAFSIDSPLNCSNSQALKIGINLSPLSNAYCNSTGEQAIQKQCSTILELSRLLKAEIVLLPHVISPEEIDDDYRYLYAIQQKLSEFGCNVTLAPKDIGFIGMKKILCECNFVLAARMHCAINAITCGTPALFLSYSDKSIGMCQFVYSNTDFVVPLSDFDSYEQISPYIKNIMAQQQTLKEYLKKKMDEYKIRAYLASEILNKLNG